MPLSPAAMGFEELDCYSEELRLDRGMEMIDAWDDHRAHVLHDPLQFIYRRFFGVILSHNDQRGHQIVLQAFLGQSRSPSSEGCVSRLIFPRPSGEWQFGWTLPGHSQPGPPRVAWKVGGQSPPTLRRGLLGNATIATVPCVERLQAQPKTDFFLSKARRDH